MIIKKYKILRSTSITAKELAKRGAEPWTVIVAEEQTGAYGKGGVPFYAPKGGLYFTIILPKINIEVIQTLNILAAFVCAKVIKENFDLEPFIKLPNDVWVNGKKVCGVLTENVVGKDVKLSVGGMGFDTNIEKFPKELENMATSLKIELGREVDNDNLLKQILKGLKEQLEIITK